MNYMTAMIQLPLVKEASKERVRTPEDVSRVCDDLRGLAQETFHVLCLDAKNNLVNRHMVFRATPWCGNGGVTVPG